jgi:L-gulonolactone oxidase
MPATPLAELSDAELRAALAPLAAPDTAVANWAGAFVCRPRGVYEPATVDDCAAVLELARREGARVRAIGVVHSPSDLALTDGYMIRMTRLNQVLEVSLTPISRAMAPAFRVADKACADRL